MAGDRATFAAAFSLSFSSEVNVFPISFRTDSFRAFCRPSRTRIRSPDSPSRRSRTPTSSLIVFGEAPSFRRCGTKSPVNQMDAQLNEAEQKFEKQVSDASAQSDAQLTRAEQMFERQSQRLQ